MKNIILSFCFLISSTSFALSVGDKVLDISVKGVSSDQGAGRDVFIGTVKNLDESTGMATVTKYTYGVFGDDVSVKISDLRVQTSEGVNGIKKGQVGLILTRPEQALGH